MRGIFGVVGALVHGSQQVPGEQACYRQQPEEQAGRARCIAMGHPGRAWRLMNAAIMRHQQSAAHLRRRHAESKKQPQPLGAIGVLSWWALVDSNH